MITKKLPQTPCSSCKGRIKKEVSDMSREFLNTRNPVLPAAVHIADSEAHIMPDGRLYLYGSYDDREDKYCSQEYHVVSTPDMEHWTVHETALHVRDIPWSGDPEIPRWPEVTQAQITPFIRRTYIKSMKKKLLQALSPSKKKQNTAAAEGAAEEPLLYAPDCIYQNGRYYLYFCMSDDSEGVAVSDRPEGPFSDPVLLPCSGIDPAIFVDDDGQSYYYWGQFNAHGVRLSEDMRSFDRADIADKLVTEETHYFHEGSSVRKVGDTYYYIFADMQRGRPTSLGYATGTSPLGPFTYRGIIIDNAGCDPESWNNHGSIEQFHGQWYVFYHRSSRGGRLHRRLCVEPIKVAEDGSIAEVPMTSQGAGEPFAPGEKIMGYQACEVKGKLFIGPDGPDAAECLQNISHKDEAVFRYVRSQGPYSRAEVCAKGTGVIELLMDGRLVGSVSCTGSAGGRYQTVSAGLNCPPGLYTLTLRFKKPKDLRIWSVTLYD